MRILLFLGAVPPRSLQWLKPTFPCDWRTQFNRHFVPGFVREALVTAQWCILEVVLTVGRFLILLVKPVAITQ